MNSSILFLVFNRPRPTQRVFNQIKRAKPPKLYIACDGPRDGNQVDPINVENVKYICSQVDWPCDVKTLYRDNNLGCGLAVSSAIDWFFSYEEEGIILEDDCLPSNSYFRFCDEMLNLHRSNENIFLVGGYNKMQRWNNHKLDYFYSYFGGIWGWATWKRAWRFYDFKMSGLESFIESNSFVDHFGRKLGLMRQKQLVKAKTLIEAGKLDTWDYQWGFARNANRGLSCMPSVSLIQNIGFESDATHTSSVSDAVFQEELEFPLRNNFNIVVDSEFDYHLLKSQSLASRVWSKLQGSLK